MVEGGREVVTQVERLVGPGLAANGREVLFLPAKQGGAGFGSAERRADAAWRMAGLVARCPGRREGGTGGAQPGQGGGGHA